GSQSRMRGSLWRGFEPVPTRQRRSEASEPQGVWPFGFIVRRALCRFGAETEESRDTHCWARQVSQEGTRSCVCEGRRGPIQAWSSAFLFRRQGEPHGASHNSYGRRF